MRRTFAASESSEEPAPLAVKTSSVPPEMSTPQSKEPRNTKTAAAAATPSTAAVMRVLLLRTTGWLTRFLPEAGFTDDSVWVASRHLSTPVFGTSDWTFLAIG